MEPIPFRLDTGATWLNLLATRGSAFGRHPEERIPTPERFADWLAAVELTPAGPVTAADLELARHLRETLRPLALSAATGEEPSPDAPDAAAELIAFLAAHDEPLRLAGAAESPGLARPAPAGAAAALGRIARQAAEQLTGPERHALKSCPESDCRGVFADPEGRRRWCPSPTCASRGRVRAHRARKATAAPTP
ncbi:CGNR zinc finger domain-containing protein [Catenulispora sp. NF23]|uniref:CGNR zinc finger domain-containing protein n=1 Tax=Catenulispora pinistramenti TaxID=2705254 RepID=A0ABS5KS75_9ACTN|nr:CGNR zinc finger domain-containing protein [Catenulispora pinistramenti]MBS2534543.1 CGNR zinc finger domain-containing protein [Catenulispora pinistramenti]MBS2548864.1 CGNR zinc finger domain-containing protein [Catenulispora pinistramenti]